MYGERIKILRKKAGLNQADLALKIGVSRPNISFWENSEYPPLEAITKVCAALGIETWKFFVNEDTLAGIMNIPADFISLFEDIMTLENDNAADLLEIFRTIVYKYKKVATVRMKRSNLYVEQKTGLDTDLSMINPEVFSNPDQYKVKYKVENGKDIELVNYFDSFAWLKH